MGRELKRVPLNFDYPLNTIWRGYLPTIEQIKSIEGILEKAPYLRECNALHDVCTKCDKIMNDCRENANHCIWHNENIRSKWFEEVPAGEGYQLWETTSEGSPVSPVFKTLEELCEWCETNATTFADFKASKEEWKDMLSKDLVCCKQGNILFI